MSSPTDRKPRSLLSNAGPTQPPIRGDRAEPDSLLHPALLGGCEESKKIAVPRSTRVWSLERFNNTRYEDG
ncbi:hypothetical protein K504DRAFT_216056 [Pleomassaria siparia CBS 279.74]|uniref:Uncharacterized protein n=1 Tax=Pleomassaria siparia CBS 279.74 TaxID=1314801 RepID=A0A6G1KFT5_9PLEO|nr:hypothetical protein K504DRAFT_216056 [Pleomassaria siparia CBS 279.74]